MRLVTVSAILSFVFVVAPSTSYGSGEAQSGPGHDSPISALRFGPTLAVDAHQDDETRASSALMTGLEGSRRGPIDECVTWYGGEIFEIDDECLEALFCHFHPLDCLDGPITYPGHPQDYDDPNEYLEAWEEWHEMMTGVYDPEDADPFGTSGADIHWRGAPVKGTASAGTPQPVRQRATTQDMEIGPIPVGINTASASLRAQKADVDDWGECQSPAQYHPNADDTHMLECCRREGFIEVPVYIPNECLLLFELPSWCDDLTVLNTQICHDHGMGCYQTSKAIPVGVWWVCDEW